MWDDINWGRFRNEWFILSINPHLNLFITIQSRKRGFDRETYILQKNKIRSFFFGWLIRFQGALSLGMATIEIFTARLDSGLISYFHFFSKRELFYDSAKSNLRFSFFRFQPPKETFILRKNSAHFYFVFVNNWSVYIV